MANQGYTYLQFPVRKDGPRDKATAEYAHGIVKAFAGRKHINMLEALKQLVEAGEKALDC